MEMRCHSENVISHIPGIHLNLEMELRCVSPSEFRELLREYPRMLEERHLSELEPGIVLRHSASQRVSAIGVCCPRPTLRLLTRHGITPLPLPTHLLSQCLVVCQVVSLLSFAWVGSARGAQFKGSSAGSSVISQSSIYLSIYQEESRGRVLTNYTWSPPGTAYDSCLVQSRRICALL